MNSGAANEGGAVQDPAQGPGQVAVAHRVGRGEIHRAGNFRVRLDEPEGPGVVGLVDPGEPLDPGADGASLKTS